MTAFSQIAISNDISPKKCPSLAPHRWFSRHDILKFIFEHWLVFEQLSENIELKGKKIERVQAIFQNNGIQLMKVQFHAILEFLSKIKDYQLKIESSFCGPKMYKLLWIDVPSAIEGFGKFENLEQITFSFKESDKKQLFALFENGKTTLKQKWVSLLGKHINETQKNLWLTVRCFDPKNGRKIDFSQCSL